MFNPGAVNLVLFCLAVGALYGNPWLGFAIGTGIVVLVTCFF